MTGGALACLVRRQADAKRRDHRSPASEGRRETRQVQPCGYDAGKKVNGCKRHIAVDMTGLLLTVLVTATSVQGRDAAP